jgi:hypothetical protein
MGPALLIVFINSRNPGQKEARISPGFPMSGGPSASRQPPSLLLRQDVRVNLAVADAGKLAAIDAGFT